MCARAVAETGWEFSRTRDFFDQVRAVEDILQRLADSFTEVNIAADFLHLLVDPGSQQPELQLTCLIKERIAAIQEQITELYCALNHSTSSYPLLKQ